MSAAQQSRSHGVPQGATLEQDLAVHRSSFSCPGGACHNTYLCAAINQQCFRFAAEQDDIRARHGAPSERTHS